ncbi:hypothetical protein ZWY2020_055021 [Hordeum vulgare]|nr:hypothetical protein ZWY2020_055021 [Hordeum vulgare]
MLATPSITGVAPLSSSNALAVALWDAQQLEVMSSSNDSPAATGGDTKPAPINPLLLASASFGSWTALNYLLSQEDKQAPPMIQPTQPASSKAALLLKGVTANGDTALHVIASNGDSKEFLKCAIIIFKRDQDLLFAVNNKDDTPLHCAARAGMSQMLSFLVELAESCNRLHELLRKENVLKETALHDAVRIGRNDTVELLLGADPDLANYPKEGTSPLYLAISLQRYTIAQTLHDKSNGNLSYHGPYGQNALHAATFRSTGVTKHVLNWNSSLTTHGDRDGNTPLHFASVFRHPEGVRQFRQLLEANPSPIYQANNNGSFPIHVAATMGAKDVLNIILEKFPSSAGLRTAQGWTFLHVAIEKKRLNIVSFACQTPSLNWILNMQDNDGNTPLHFAVKSTVFYNFCSLCGNMEVDLSLANNNKQTPLDLSTSLFPRGLNHVWNNDQMIYVVLNLVGAKSSSVLLDHIIEMDSFRVKPEDKVQEAQKMKEASQMLGIGSVLIATVSFGATFAVPGGFIADDHANRGTPTLAGRVPRPGMGSSPDIKTGGRFWAMSNDESDEEEVQTNAAASPTPSDIVCESILAGYSEDQIASGFPSRSGKARRIPSLLSMTAPRPDAPAAAQAEQQAAASIAAPTGAGDPGAAGVTAGQRLDAADQREHQGQGIKHAGRGGPGAAHQGRGYNQSGKGGPAAMGNRGGSGYQGYRNYTNQWNDFNNRSNWNAGGGHGGGGNQWHRPFQPPEGNFVEGARGENFRQ